MVKPKTPVIGISIGREFLEKINDSAVQASMSRSSFIKSVIHEYYAHKADKALK